MPRLKLPSLVRCLIPALNLFMASAPWPKLQTRVVDQHRDIGAEVCEDQVRHPIAIEVVRCNGHGKAGDCEVPRSLEAAISVTQEHRDVSSCSGLPSFHPPLGCP